VLIDNELKYIADVAVYDVDWKDCENKMIFNVIKEQRYLQELSTITTLDFIPWLKLENKSILITGATGLIGSFLVDVVMYRNKHYDANISLYAVSRNGQYGAERFRHYLHSPLFHYIQQDISEKLSFDFNAHFIIHAASNSSPSSYVSDPVGTLKANVWGVANLLEYAVKTHTERLLYVSSGEVYGEGDGSDFIEKFSGYVDCLTPRACYPSGKRAAETLCASYAVQYSMNVVVARPCHIYGPTFTSSDNRAYVQFIENVLHKKDVVLKSEGTQVRSYCYVADCVSALLFLLLCGESGQAYNIANKESNISIAELAEIIAMAGGQKVIFDLPSETEKKGYSIVSRAVLSAEKLESLGWKPIYDIDKGINNTIKILDYAQSQ
jgi:nucleoside-diphosphate-sugar epimerase